MSLPPPQQFKRFFSEQIEEELSSAQECMYRDEPLSPKMISTLLHIGVSLPASHVHESPSRMTRIFSVLYGIGIILVSILLAVALGTLFAYTHEIGPFYNGVKTAQF